MEIGYWCPVAVTRRHDRKPEEIADFFQWVNRRARERAKVLAFINNESAEIHKLRTDSLAVYRSDE